LQGLKKRDRIENPDVGVGGSEGHGLRICRMREVEEIVVAANDIFGRARDSEV
jgi:hypothetical protein